MAVTPYPASDFPRQPAALVTGAASERGIGRATAHRLAREGWAVAVMDLDEAACEALAHELSQTHGVPALGLGVDISNEQQVIDALAQVDAELPQLVGVVNNAGISSPTPFTEVSTEEWKRVFDVNVHGTFFVTR
ncbi:MAG: SDR family NAD(P)-dependent oxidoreductase, partial [Brachybacterium alimentarium]